jgi:dihydrolipoamide dehydrogenase
MYDLIVLGGGPGGYVAAERAGEAGLKVLLVEKSHLGGVCLNEGCIPTKTLLNAAKNYVHAKEGEFFGVTAKEVTFSLTKAMEWKQKVMETLRKGIAGKMKSHHVEVVNGNGELLKGNKVKVGDKTYESKNVIIATGSSPFVPPIPGHDLPHVLTSTGILNITALPKKLAVIGGGVIGMEFASFFDSLGIEVHVFEMLPKIIPFMDGELSKVLMKELKNTTVHLSTKVESISKDKVNFSKDGKAGSVEADMVLMSVGRRPNVKGCGFEAIGLDMDNRGIVVDEQMRTNLPGVYAIGDVNGRSLLAHSASRMGEVAVNIILGKKDRMRYGAIPWVVYSLPELAGCGMTEDMLKEKNIPYKKASMPLRASGRYMAENGLAAPGICKVLAHAETDVLLGVHMVGGACSEMIYGVGVMLETELRVQDIKEIVFPHPTVAEIIKDTLWELK